MEIAITRISENGQIVIPAEIRRDAKIGKSTKFLVINRGGNILLKQIRSEALENEMALMEKVMRGEEQIKKGKYSKADSSMKAADIDRLLT